MPRKRYYLGRGPGALRVFTAESDPTPDSHGHLYKSVVGPFRTRRGAMLTALVGLNNPHIQHVNDAERIAKREQERKLP